jgi:hypothetical protein
MGELKSKLYPGLKVIIFVAGAVTLQACFFGGGHPYEPAYGPRPYADGPGPAYAYAPPPPAYVYGRPPAVGDYDDHQMWHDRDWWVHNNHPWVQQHHPDWVAHEHAHQSENVHR